MKERIRKSFSKMGQKYLIYKKEGSNTIEINT